MPSRFSIISLFCAALLLCCSAADAYIGPIIIIGAVGSMFGWVAAVGVAVLVVVSYPFYLLYRKKNNRKQSKVEEVESIEEGSAGG
jgi:membrane protein implicated in regulation of membrane protease activity